MSKKPTSILFLTRLFYPHVGGVEKHVAEISKILARQGVQVTIISEKTAGQKFKYKNIKHHQIPISNHGWFKKFEIWQWLLVHKDLIKQADIVHCHDVFFWYLPFRFIFPFKPVYTTFHGYESYPVKKKAIIVRKLSEKLSKGNICVGAFIKKWYGTKPTFIIYGGVLPHKKNIQTQLPPSALFVGRLDKDTGILDYANAVSLVQKKLPGFNLGIVGNGQEQMNLQKRGFEFYGSLENYSKLFKKYRFVFASGYLAILEAFAAQKLVFALYNTPLKKDYLLKAPFRNSMVIVGSVQELREKLTYFAKHQKKEKLLIEIAYKYAQKQSWGTVADQYRKLWRIDL